MPVPFPSEHDVNLTPPDAMEARVIAGALGYIHDYGVVGLPMHDALIVPWEALSLAREGIRGAFRAFLDIDPNLTP